ncbi:MAG TPA: MauE/DoxX family redox-associated membrane protein [Anaerolineae bacterium]|nr:MauE/DoxX family redox-associated membrane protein [Anaerolineae bacterium]
MGDSLVAHIGILAAQWSLAAVFLAASIPKLLNRRRFVGVVLAYDVLPIGLVRPFALVLPWIEFGVGASLLIGLAPRPTAAASSALFLCFMAALGVNVLRGRKDLSCGCFGSGHTVGWLALLRDVLLFGVSLYIAVCGDGSTGVWRWLVPASALPSSVEPGAATVSLCTFLGLLVTGRLIRQLQHHTKARIANDWTLAR